MDEKNFNLDNEEIKEDTESNTVPLKENVSLETEEATFEQTPPAPEPTVVYRWEYHEQAKVDRKRRKEYKAGGKLVYAAVLTAVFLLTMLLLVGAIMLGNAKDDERDEKLMIGSISEVYEECLPSCVSISTTKLAGSSIGSGIIMTSDGYIATNYHVIENASGITATMSDGTIYDAEFIDGDALNDIAVIKIEARDLKAAKIGSSKNSKVGDQVMAIGTPHSMDFRGTMTSGYISALDRRVVDKNANGTIDKIRLFIQTDTSINPGNSGGPLFNMAGEVIGITTQKIAGTDYEGLGFALPMETVIDMINDIIENGRITDPDAGGAVKGAALGITGMTVIKDTKYLVVGENYLTVKKDPETGVETVTFTNAITYDTIHVDISDEEALAKQGITDYYLFTAEESGVCIVKTSEGFDAAEKLKINDIIISADGISCKQIQTLQSLIADKKIGDSLQLKVYRDGEILSISLELGNASTMSD